MIGGGPVTVYLSVRNVLWATRGSHFAEEVCKSNQFVSPLLDPVIVLATTKHLCTRTQTEFSPVMKIAFQWAATLVIWLTCCLYGYLATTPEFLKVWCKSGRFSWHNGQTLWALNLPAFRRCHTYTCKTDKTRLCAPLNVQCKQTAGQVDNVPGSVMLSYANKINLFFPSRF